MTAANKFITWIVEVFLWTLAAVGVAGMVIGLLTIMVLKERKEDK